MHDMWTTDACPQAIACLDNESDRRRAVERANALREAGMHPIRAISQGIADVLDAQPEDGPPGPAQFVYFDLGEWRIAPEDRHDFTHRFYRFDDAVFRAVEIARRAGSAVYVSAPDGSLVEKIEFFGADGDAAKGVHVIPRDDGWAVRYLSDGEHSYEAFATKRDAVQLGRERAREHDAMLTIHYASGEVQDTVDYAHH